MMQQDLIEIDAAEHYQKNSHRNRCYLASSQGKIMLSVPLQKGKHQQKPIKNVIISYAENWVALHLKTMLTNYHKAPFFDYLYPEIELILKEKPKYLHELNWSCLRLIFNSFRWQPIVAYHLHYHQERGLPSARILPAYPQVFENKVSFIPDLSVLDLLFCMGPQSKYILTPS